jgi:Domain of unknown function (DUF4382)
MKSMALPNFRVSLRLLAYSSFFLLIAILLSVASCGGGSTSQTTMTTGMGSMVVSISDPPSCAAPSGEFSHVYITIRSVQAHISSTANDNSPGWQELAPQLASQPMQVDLLNLPKDGSCLLAQLGSTSSLPVGDYQQIRLLLVSNAASTGPVPSSNQCASLGQFFNCVVDKDGIFHKLDLSSQANTGLKVPPGQVAGGPIHVAAGQSVDINVDFNTCASLVPMPNGDFRLRPTLTASQVSPNTTGISGQLVDSNTHQPIPNALVALEQQDGAGIDRVFMQASTDSNGQFRFCPLPSGMAFDLVADAVNGTLAYNATVVLNVMSGTSTSNIPLIAETGSPNGPGIIDGQVTAVNGSSGAQIDAALSAFQTISLAGGGMRTVTIPLENSSSATSTPLLAVQDATPCTGAVPPGAFCQQYTLVVPASNPNIGVFAAGNIAFTQPAAGNVLYTVEARATVPMTSNMPICSPSSQTTSVDSTSQPLKVTPGTTTTAKEIDFSGCS